MPTDGRGAQRPGYCRPGWPSRRAHEARGAQQGGQDLKERRALLNPEAPGVETDKKVPEAQWLARVCAAERVQVGHPAMEWHVACISNLNEKL